MTSYDSIPNTAKDLPLEALSLTDRDSLTWKVASAEIDAFATISGDRNPLHIDAVYAREAGFVDRVAHGMLLGAKISGFIGMILPGSKCLLLEQTLAFPAPVYSGDEVTISGEIVEMWIDQSMLRLKIRAEKMKDGKTISVIRGSVLCKVLS